MIDYKPSRRLAERNFNSMLQGYFYLILFILSLGVLERCVIEPEPALKKCHGKSMLREVKMTEYFKRNGSPVPEKMAQAVLKTNKPKLMAAIAVRESNGNPKAVGDGGKSKGAFQVQKRHWGVVPQTAAEQALQSERILNELLAASNGNLSKALNAYGGDVTKKVYARNILQELQNIP